MIPPKVANDIQAGWDKMEYQTTAGWMGNNKRLGRGWGKRKLRAKESSTGWVEYNKIPTSGLAAWVGHKGMPIPVIASLVNDRRSSFRLLFPAPVFCTVSALDDRL